MIRIAAIALLSVSLSGLPAYADEAKKDGANPATTTAIPGEITTMSLRPDTLGPALPAMWTPTTRPAALPSLCVSFAALQAFDIYSTTQALSRGAHEANPMMRGVVGNPALFWTVKAAATVAPLLAAERLWKTNKAASIAVMMVGNGVMAAVAAHNANILRQYR